MKILLLCFHLTAKILILLLFLKNSAFERKKLNFPNIQEKAVISWIAASVTTKQKKKSKNKQIQVEHEQRGKWIQSQQKTKWKPKKNIPVYYYNKRMFLKLMW